MAAGSISSQTRRPISNVALGPVETRSEVPVPGLRSDGQVPSAVPSFPRDATIEPGAAPSAQPRGFDQIDDLVGLQRKGFTQAFVTLMLQVEIEREAIRLANVFRQ